MKVVLFIVLYLIIAGIVSYFTISGMDAFGSGDDFYQMEGAILIAIFWPVTIWFFIAWVIFKWRKWNR